MTTRRTPAKPADAGGSKAMMARLVSVDSSITLLQTTVTTLAGEVSSVKDAITRTRESASDNERQIGVLARELAEQTKALKSELAEERKSREADRVEFLASLRKQQEGSADALTKVSKDFSEALEKQNAAAVTAIKDAFYKDIGHRIVSWAITFCLAGGGLWTIFKNMKP